MKSPFPGMDPFLEAHWRDVHASLVVYIRDALQGALPGSLFARVEERVFLESEGDDQPLRSTHPDVRVVGWRPPEAGESVTTAEGATAVLDEPYVLQTILEPATETFLEIIDASSGNRVVTVIEVLSPTNKLPGPGQEMYLTKQKEMKQGDVNLVEIDLVRQGDRVTSVPGKQQPAHLQSLYQVCVWRPHRFRHEIYPRWESGCPGFAFLCGPATRTFAWICKPSSTRPIAMDAISRRSTTPSRCRRPWVERMKRDWLNC